MMASSIGTLAIVIAVVVEIEQQPITTTTAITNRIVRG